MGFDTPGKVVTKEGMVSLRILTGEYQSSRTLVVACSSIKWMSECILFEGKPAEVKMWDISVDGVSFRIDNESGIRLLTIWGL